MGCESERKEKDNPDIDMSDRDSATAHTIYCLSPVLSVVPPIAVAPLVAHAVCHAPHAHAVVAPLIKV